MIIGQRTKGEYPTTYHFVEVEEIDDSDETYYCRFDNSIIRHWFNFEDVNLINEV